MNRLESMQIVDEFEEYFPYYDIDQARAWLKDQTLDEDIRTFIENVIKYHDEVIGTHRMDYY